MAAVMDLNMALSRAAAWEANPRILPPHDVARDVIAALAAEVRRLTAAAPVPAGNPADLEGLTAAQAQFMASVHLGRVPMIRYLRERTPVRIMRNRELTNAPPWALVIASNTEFWLGCYATPLAASTLASRLDLPVVAQ